MKKRNIADDPKLAITILNFLHASDIDYKYMDSNTFKTVIFYNKKDAIKLLKYLFKNYRFYYYHVDATLKNNRKNKSIDSKIKSNINFLDEITSYYITFKSVYCIN